jgi:hypothetical protein
VGLGDAALLMPGSPGPGAPRGGAAFSRCTDSRGVVSRWWLISPWPLAAPPVARTLRRPTRRVESARCVGPSQGERHGYDPERVAPTGEARRFSRRSVN